MYIGLREVTKNEIIEHIYDHQHSIKNISGKALVLINGATLFTV